MSSSSHTHTSSGQPSSAGRSLPPVRGHNGVDEGTSELSRYVGVLWERRWAVLLMLLLWPMLASL